MISNQQLKWIDEWLLEQNLMQQGYQIVTKNGKRYKQTVIEEELHTKQEFILLLDHSSSMAHLRKHALDVFNNEIQTIKTEAARTGITTHISIYTFGSTVTFHGRYRAEDVNPLSYEAYRIGGMTALRDAISRGITEAYATHDISSSFALHVITDGQENTSMTTQGELKKQLTQTNATDRWTVFAHGPVGSREVLEALGIPSGNIAEWEQTEEGLQCVGRTTTQSLSTYFTDRAAGATNSKTMLVTPDLAGVKVEDKLTPVLGITLLEVAKESKIKEFVERKLLKDYMPGTAFYQLMKKERVEPNKRVMVMNKTNKRIYGGSDARTLIGLPNTGRCRVEPGNHSNYDIFIQSLSNNRILPRGTKLLVEPS